MCYSGISYRNHSGDHNEGIACRYVVASNRAQAVRTYTCVTTTQAFFPVLTEPRSNCHHSQRVSDLSHCIEHLCPDTQPSQDSLVLSGFLILLEDDGTAGSAAHELSISDTAREDTAPTVQTRR